jgi:hypothetical protein
MGRQKNINKMLHRQTDRHLDKQYRNIKRIEMKEDTKKDKYR